ncbi:hypothetical protein EOA19_22890 [Mesorhizobium sp. M7A.F.Ca.US.010.02.1.1]|nr:hypothetical protein EOA19_22890 [Mesorhizobium sp. M7A.F.Ca.US.010.02.1.1]
MGHATALPQCQSSKAALHKGINADPRAERATHNRGQEAAVGSRSPVVDRGKRLGIAVHDHIIIGRKGHSSTKGLPPIYARIEGRDSKSGTRFLLHR